MAKKMKKKKMWELTPEEWIAKLAQSMSKNGFEQEKFFNPIQDELIDITNKIDDLEEKLDELAEIEEMNGSLSLEETAQYDRLMSRSDREHERFMNLYTSLSILLNIYLIYAFSIPEKIAIMITNNIMADLLDDDLFALIMKHSTIFFSYYILMTRNKEINFQEMEDRNEELFEQLEEDLRELMDNFLNGDDDEDDELDYDEFVKSIHFKSSDDSTPPIFS